MRSAIIFGGSGFIGSHLAETLRRNEYRVTIADLVEPNVSVDEFYESDVRNPIRIARSSPYDVVFNLAAVHRTPGHAPSEYYETNLLGAQNVVDWCTEGGERRMCFTSSIAVYGPSETPKSEASDPVPNSDYGRSKLLAEAVHRRWLTESEDRQLSIVRPAVIFGHGERGNFTRLAGALRRRTFMYAGRKDVVKSCGYVGDLVEAMLFTQASGQRDVTFNFCYPTRYTIEEICMAFHDVAGFELPRTLPAPALKFVMSLLSLVNPADHGSLSSARIAKLTASTNIEPSVLKQSGFVWPTTIDTALAAWRESSPDDQFV